MQDRVGQPSVRGQGTGDDRLRPLLAAILVLAVLLAARSGPGLTWSNAWIGPWHDRGHGIALLAALEVVFAALLVLLWVRARRSPAASQPAAALRVMLMRVIAFAVVALPLPFAVALIRLPKTRPRPRNGLTPHRPPRSFLVHQTGPASSAGAEVVRYVLLGLLVVLLIGAIVLLRRLRQRSAAPAAELTEAAGDDTSALRTAVEAGRLALGELTEPRMAIINCYLAMERSLAEAGTARTGPETPRELLARSRTAGLLHTTAADELTGLFYAARYSTHQVRAEARDRAQRALDEIAAELAAGTGQMAATP